MSDIYTIYFPEDRDKKYASFDYPGGEHQLRILTPEFGALEKADDVYILATIKTGEVMELALLCDAVRKQVERTIRLHLVLPYLPYSRADRRFCEGDCFGLKVFGKMLDSIGFDSVTTLDVHSSAAFKQVANLANVSPVPIIETVIEQLAKPQVVFPDDGAALRYTGLRVPSLKCYKKRDPASGALSGFEVPHIDEFGGAHSILIVDDICDGGGTFLGIAEKLATYGIPLYLYVTHGIFSKGVNVLLAQYKRLFTTTSLLSAKDTPGLQVIPCEGFIMSKLLDKPTLWRNSESQRLS